MADNEYLVIKESAIHHLGAFAKKDIAAGTKIIEYIGTKISKAASAILEKSSETKFKTDPSQLGQTYIFELDEEFDINGDVPQNLARHINHSCDPNCQIEYLNSHIWIVAKKDILAGQELTYNYGFDINQVNYLDNPCYCGSANCVGYILQPEDWDKIKTSQG